MSYKFPKNEKLKSSKTIAKLFSGGKTHFKFPLKLYYIPQLSIEKNQAAFAVPKRNFKLAVTRNRIKRQIREAYRLNKQSILEDKDQKYVMLFLFLGKENPKFEQVEKAMISLLKKLKDENSP